MVTKKITKKKAILTPLDDKKRVEVTIDEKPKFYMHLDADRDGKLDDNPNDLDKWEWGKAKRGAIILVNNNGTPRQIDNEDEMVNGGADMTDIAPVDIRRKGPKPPASWKATLSVSVDNAKHIRIFDKRSDSGKEIIGPNQGEKYELPDLNFDKKELAVEAVHYAGKYDGKDFDGLVDITLTIKDGSTDVHEHKAKVRVAPWIMFNHFDKPEKVYVVETPDNTASGFVAALTAATNGAGLSAPEKISSTTWGDDRWMQDIMEFGYSQLPGQQALRNVLETPRGRELKGMPKTLVTTELGYAMPAPVPLDARGNEVSSSLNSGGNLECTPPFTASNGKEFPFGRMYFCRVREDDSTDKLATGYAEFLNAQLLQKPIEIDAGWLAVGHVDEIISFVPAKNKLGFKLLLASPKLGMEILDKNPTALLLPSRNYVRSISAEMSASEFLKKGIKWGRQYVMTAKEIKSYNTECQGKIDSAEKQFTTAIGLTKDDIAYVPIIYIHPNSTDPAERRADALTAGMVNMLVLGNECISPKPFGPTLGGTDLFAEHYRQILKDCGLNVTFIDDWYTYHLLKGEVHCGTNTLRKPDIAKKWWEFQP